MKFVKIFSFATLLYGASASGQDSLHVSRSAHLFDYWQTAMSVKVEGSLAYVATRWSGLRIVSIVNPASPYEVGFFDTEGDAREVAVAGSYAYVADEYGLHVIDVTNPASPFEAGSCAAGGFGVEVAGNHAYVEAGANGLRIVDISNPLAPVQVGSYTGIVYDVDVAGSYVYVAAYGYGGFRILDVTDPALPVEVGYLGTVSPVAVDVSGNYAYLAAYDDGLRIVDVSNPAAPVEVGSFPWWECDDLVVSGNFVYVASGYYGIIVFDVSDPANPTGLDDFNTPGDAYGIAVGGNIACVADAYSLRLINIADPMHLLEAGFFDKWGAVGDVAAQGDYSYSSNGNRGLYIVDVASPASPVVMSVYDPGYVGAVEVAGEHAYLQSLQTFQVLNISNPAAPFEEGFYSLFDTEPTDIAVAGDYAYLTVNGPYADLIIMSIADPYNPWVVAELDFGQGSVRAVDVEGTFAFVVDDYYFQLRVIDVGIPDQPVEVGSLGTVACQGVDVSGSYAYVATSGSGLRVIDVSNPAQPVEVGFCNPTPGSYSNDVKVAGNYAYVAGSMNGLRVIDISDPASPAEVGYYDASSLAGKVAVSGCNAFLAEQDQFGVYDVSFFACPSPPRAPEHLVIEPEADHVRLSWLPVTQDASGHPIDISRYVVYRSADAALWDSIGVPNPPDTTMFYDATATRVHGFYRVRALGE